MEKENVKRGKVGVVVNDHVDGGGRSSPAPDDPGVAVGSGAGPQAQAGTSGNGPNIVIHGRGAQNWEVLVDGTAVARFDTKAEAFQWAELLQGKEGDGDE